MEIDDVQDLFNLYFSGFKKKGDKIYPAASSTSQIINVKDNQISDNKNAVQMILFKKQMFVAINEQSMVESTVFPGIQVDPLFFD